MCINIDIQCIFADMSVFFCYAWHLPSHHTKGSTKGGGRRPPPYWWKARLVVPYMVQYILPYLAPKMVPKFMVSFRKDYWPQRKDYCATLTCGSDFSLRSSFSRFRETQKKTIRKLKVGLGDKLEKNVEKTQN